MPDALISKKELLEVTGISYGQLYRWKRKNIIPEEWFIKKASFTGQETFFPRDKVLARIQKIQEMKDDYSLDDIADFFSPDAVNVEMTGERLVAHHVLHKETWETYRLFFEKDGTLDFTSILFLDMVQQLTDQKTVTVEECGRMITFLQTEYKAVEGMPYECIGLRKKGTSFWLLIASPSRFIAEQETEVIGRIDITESVNRLKIKLASLHK
ncbi:DUF4004 family protein [Aneurinibacillus migulanus]|uniref:DUF4004 domain-containing protein n=1 Tax=Aneurinibacillus migulanus TaxID=47500 RepID=A0A0D1XX10_ANEMI|nr:DUF4004 family protein [Aneurinibacillus migulanus]KIV58746.1 hypothetical protein TS65_05100 [Aneurinibacillus migulanus]KON96437.1 hypothetical protein AF333_14090 [Aneurinibacillus migulanus]MCP1356903.1 YhbD family protein [Aneurinibacillus migulanus]MED0892387.1 DUF4004 family protein [Aneurinibacillus migulanus]MED1615660.1 DUF4004 family protein [Aneurinibacillus migulanus]